MLFRFLIASAVVLAVLAQDSPISTIEEIEETKSVLCLDDPEIGDGCQVFEAFCNDPKYADLAMKCRATCKRCDMINPEIPRPVILN